ncbi:neutral zinc metallopeptidase [Actinoallomurus purpureus]|uniref:neutral zinc metallopeptidase n=1 Tax=Actinoallomurus purpureus TaxID=478114 RepID=UPI002092433F|nr:neutral zinc metallopeptidase [Actinoallomurus purpureus]MCO6011506.1 neutral zinc metallopeptidase [Actinoallomurus purpureus]
MVGPYRRRPPDGPEPQGPPSRQWRRPARDLGYLPPRRPPRRRSTAGTIVGALGGFAGLCAVAIVAYSLAGPDRSAPSLGTAEGPPHAGSRQAAVSGPLYDSGALDPVGCALPAIREHDDESMRVFLDRLSDCLDEAWRRQFAKAALPGFAAPHRVFWSESGTSPCGSYPAPGAAAFYCPANDTMYVGLGDVVETADGEPVSHYAVYARVIAHEYGHHVQEDAGILEYGHRLMVDAATAARNEASRRIELQAQCLAGAFLSAERDSLPMTAAQYRAVLADARARGDEDEPADQRDHGTGAHYAGWLARGYTQRVLSSCNTWTASPSDVE